MPQVNEISWFYSIFYSFFSLFFFVFISTGQLFYLQNFNLSIIQFKFSI